MITPLIDYKKIAVAQAFYGLKGFVELPVPWIIQYPAYFATRPTDRKEFYTLDGYLNASGEQSFLELMLADQKLSRNMCVTACFREEPLFDDLHQRYFMKLELIDTDVSQSNLFAMIGLAQNFFEKYLPIRIIPMDGVGEAFDIVGDRSGIELGSYGIRRYKNLQWIYGTGIALPRLDTVLRISEK